MLQLPFDKVRIGSVVQIDGKFGSDVFNLLRLGNYIKQTGTQSGYTRISGSSTYNSAASSHYGSLSVAGQYGVPFVSSVQASLETSYGKSSASSSKSIELEAYSFGTNLSLDIQWDQLSPKLLITCMTASLQAENSPLLNVLKCFRDVVDLVQQPGIDINSSSPELQEKIQALSTAKADFRTNWGVGFVSAVQIGGAAKVTGSFSEQTESSNSQFNIKATVSTSSVETSSTIGSAYGQTSNEALRQATFKVEDEYTGGNDYQQFANQYRDQFANKMGSEIWDSNFAKAPDIPKMETSISPPPLIKPKETKTTATAANDFNAVTDDKARDKASQAVAASAGAAKTADAIQQQEDLNKQALNAINEAVAKVDVSSADFTDISASPPMHERSQTLLKSSSGGMRAVAPAAGPMPKAGANPDDLAESVGTDTAENNTYWESQLDSYAVVGVTITRWEDILPGFTLNSPFDDQEAINKLNRLLALLTAANESRNISKMFAMASVFNPTSAKDWTAKASIFANFSNRLSDAASNSQLSSFDEVVNANLTDGADRNIFNKYREYSWLFEAHRIGMGGYMEFPADSSFSTDGIYYRVGAGDRKSTKTAGDQYVWFTPKLDPVTPSGKPGASSVSDNTRYSDSIKFYPVIAPDCSGFYLMVAEPSWGLNGFYMNGFFGNEGAYLKLFPFSCIQMTLCNGKAEAVLTFPEPVELFKLKDFDLYTIGYKDKHAPATGDLLDKYWESRNKRQNVKLHLVPFAPSELTRPWKGFILSTPNLAPDVSAQTAQLRTALITNSGVNYWTETSKKGKIDSFATPYQSTVIQRFSWKWGLPDYVKT